MRTSILAIADCFYISGIKLHSTLQGPGLMINCWHLMLYVDLVVNTPFVFFKRFLLGTSISYELTQNSAKLAKVYKC